MLLFVVGVLGAALIASVREMRQMPAALMRPKAPKAGSRILLERVRPLWSRMSFLNKVTARNIFRFKARLIMTVGGVAGCTALILCGLAINDTVAALGPNQYRGVDQYDMLAVANDGDEQALRKKLVSDGTTTAIMETRIENGEITQSARDSVMQLLRTQFRPEFLNRIDDIVFYKPLEKDEIAQIVRLLAGHLASRLHEKNIDLVLSDAAVNAIAEAGFDPVYGARPLKRYMQSHLETMLARKIVAGDVLPGQTVRVDVDANGELTVSAENMAMQP